MKSINKIIIIRFSSLGDIMLTEPISRILHELYPHAKIDYLTKNAFVPIVNTFTAINKIYLWENKYQLIKVLRAQKYDLAIDLHDKLNSFIVKKSINAKRTITYDKHHLRRKLICKKLSKRPIYSTVNLYLSIFRKLKDNDNIVSKIPQFNESYLLDKDITETRLPELFYPKIYLEKNLNPFIIETFQKFNISHKKIIIGIFPGASFASKQYPASYFSNFLNNIPDTWNCQFILLGSHEDKYVCTEIRKNCVNKPIDLSGYFSIEKLINFINYLHGVITNDSGPMHLAAALNLPQIAIFGSTHTSLGFRPLNKFATIMEANVKCQPCTLHGEKECPKRHFRCMKNISSGDLTSAFKQLLEKEILHVD